MKSPYKFGNLLFCPIAHQDLADIKDWRNEQMDICRQWKPLTDYNQEEWWKELSTSDKQVIFAIKDSDGELIGYCGLVYIDYINRKAEFSIQISTERAIKNYIYREDFMATAKMICEYGFKTLNLNKITTETFEFRKYQIKLLEQFGFQRDGMLRKNHYEQGKYYDSINHSILRKEYLKQE